MTDYVSDAQARSLILDVGRRLYHSGFVASNDGNITCKVGDNAIWATPTGVSKGFMTEEMLVKMDLDGNILESTYKPSSEIKMHLCVFKENPQVQGVVHAHPLTATAFACWYELRGASFGRRDPGFGMCASCTLCPSGNNGCTGFHSTLL